MVGVGGSSPLERTIALGSFFVFVSAPVYPLPALLFTVPHAFYTLSLQCRCYTARDLSLYHLLPAALPPVGCRFIARCSPLYRPLPIAISLIAYFLAPLLIAISPVARCYTARDLSLYHLLPAALPPVAHCPTGRHFLRINVASAFPD